MMQVLHVAENEIAYTLQRKSRARNMRISVRHDGDVIVTQPSNISDERRDEFLRLKIKWILKKRTFFQNCASYPIKKEDYRHLKARAMECVNERLETYRRLFGFSSGVVRIRNQSTRWGSCSRRGNLSFNVRIALLPPHLADYIVAHEVCHLGEFNHSKDFWALVGRAIPTYNEARKALRHIALR